MLSSCAEMMVDATLIRAAAGSYSDGLWTAGTATETTIRIIFPQPVTPEELAALPEGESARNYVKTYTATELFLESDSIEYDSREFKVWQVFCYSFSGNYYKVIMREKKANE